MVAYKLSFWERKEIRKNHWEPKSIVLILSLYETKWFVAYFYILMALKSLSALTGTKLCDLYYLIKCIWMAVYYIMLKLNKWGKVPPSAALCCRIPRLLSGSKLFLTLLTLTSCFCVSATLPSTLQASAHLPSDQCWFRNKTVFILS